MTTSFKCNIVLAACLFAPGAFGIARAADGDFDPFPSGRTTDAIGKTNVTELTEATDSTSATSFKFFGNLPAGADRLAALRGGSDTTTSDMTLRGTVGSNMASDIVSGVNAISAGSFANAVGIPIVIQNSGTNVLIQNATIINLQMH